jgi:nicotinamide mononucleotide transporter
MLTPLELIASFFGILSVWYSKKESIWVYPSGLLNTLMYIYLSFKGDLYGEAGVNLYYTIMSLYGWHHWLKRDAQSNLVVSIRRSSFRQKVYHFVFFAVLYTLIYLLLLYIQTAFAPGAVPWADALASASAFTAMWLMTQKKVESWIWWIITNITAIPLYFVKGYGVTSAYYTILLVLAVLGWQEWNKKANEQFNRSSATHPSGH